MEDYLGEEKARSRALSEENLRIKRELRRVFGFLRSLSSSTDDVYIEFLTQENDQLRMENDHLRNLLLLGTHTFANEISSEADMHNKSLISEHSSFHLMTPPRSPSHGPLQGKIPIRRGTSSRTGVSSPPSVLPNSATAHDMQLEGLLADIADVGPPMSPPPDSSAPVVPRRVGPPDMNDSVDAAEAEKGSKDVDHDLSSSN